MRIIHVNLPGNQIPCILGTNQPTFILDCEKDICFDCPVIQGKTTLTACENLCERHSSCDRVGKANDLLANYETALIGYFK